MAKHTHTHTQGKKGNRVKSLSSLTTPSPMHLVPFCSDPISYIDFLFILLEIVHEHTRKYVNTPLSSFLFFKYYYYYATPQGLWDFNSRIEPKPLAVGVWSHNHWTTTEFLLSSFLKYKLQYAVNRASQVAQW